MLKLETQFLKQRELIKILNDEKNEDGITYITDEELSKKLDRSKQSLKNYFEFINRENKEIEKVVGGYKINVTKLEETETYKKIIEYILFVCTIEVEEFRKLKEQEIANILGMKLKTLQMAKTATGICKNKHFK